MGEPARAHADRLLSTLRDEMDIVVTGVDVGLARSGYQDWARSGAMALTGRRDGPALPCRGAPASAVRGALAVLRALAAQDHDLEDVDERLLGERAAIAGFTRQGPWSAGGALRMLPTADGWVGVNLPRPEDRDLVPALTEGAVAHGHDLWTGLGNWLAERRRFEVVERAALLGLPLGVVPRAGDPPDPQDQHRWGDRLPGWVVLRRGGPRPTGSRSPLVVLLAALWAGPLAAHLLQRAGAEVVVVESVTRPDGARAGPGPYHDLLHAGQAAVALDLPTRSAVAALRSLVSAASVVVDGSRPRAMQRLGVDVDAAVRDGTTWVSVTGYGRTGPWANRPAFGDDAAVAAGLVARDAEGPVPAGDAIADPLAGVHAAVAALAALQSDHAWLVDVALRDVARAAAVLDPGPMAAVEPAPPIARVPAGRAPALGADTDTVLELLGARP